MPEMTLDEANAEAIRRIDAARASGQWWLDLGDLPIVAVPWEIEQLKMQLRVLALGMDRLQINGDEFAWTVERSRPCLVSDVGPLHALTQH